MAKTSLQVLKADPERYPGLAKNPALERALRIQQALAQGRPRDEAVGLAEQAMGRRAPRMSTARPAANAGNPRKASKARPTRKPSASGRAR